MENTINQQPRYSSVIKWSLVIGIVIVLNLFFNYLISLVYESPKYDDFCKAQQTMEVSKTKEACVTKGGQWNDYGKPEIVNGEMQPQGYCDEQFTCRKEYDDTRKIYERNVFVTLVVVGVILVALSFVLAFNWIVSVSFSMGGILSIIIASIRYWSDAENLIRVIILFLALVALIYFAIKKFRD